MSNYDHFLDLKAVQQELHRHVLAYRRELAMRLNLTAVEYEHTASQLLANDPERSAWNEGVAEGLRTAAAELDSEKVEA